MKHIILSILLGGAAICGIAQTRADSIRAKFLDPNCTEVLVAVHRGDWRNYAENTLEGVENAVRLGADIVEVDLWRTADGELVLMHDPKVDRTTTGKGKIADLTLDEIRALQIRNGVMGRTPYRVPTLRELLVAQKGKVLINLDKAFDYFDQVMELLNETGTTDQIIMKGRAPAAEVKERYGKYLDRVIYMPIVEMDKPGAEETIEEYLTVLKPAAIEVNYKDSTSRVPIRIGEQCKGRTRVWMNTLWASLCGGRDDFASLVNPEEGFGFLVDSIGTSIIQTDQPKYLMDWLGDRRLKPWKPDPAQLKRYRKYITNEQYGTDWAKFGRYAKANKKLEKSPAVVFMGNSITDHWARHRPDFFTSHGIAGRGVSGQTTSHMLVRFRSDVVDLKPKAVVILAGINDIAHNNGDISIEHIAGNIASMCDIARAAGITPIIATVLPSSKIPWRPAVGNPAEQIKQLNALLLDYALKNNIEYVDYYSVMTDGDGGMKPEYTTDGVHVTDLGYQLMEGTVLSGIKKYLNKCD